MTLIHYNRKLKKAVWRLYVQGDDHGGLTPGFVDFDLLCYSICPILLGQVKIEQRWHGKRETGRTPKFESTKCSVKPPWSPCMYM